MTKKEYILCILVKLAGLLSGIEIARIISKDNCNILYYLEPVFYYLAVLKIIDIYKEYRSI